MTPTEHHETRLTSAHWLLLFTLAAVQLCHTLDFILVIPLGDQLEVALHIPTSAFGMVVGAYGVAAFASGLLLAPWLDRFDRKRSLLFLLGGFTLGTLMCALARDFYSLLAGRAIAGAFGGVVAANVLAIVGDAFPDKRRGLATGVVMSAFSVATIVGVPAGLFLAGGDPHSWWVPFAWLAAGSAGMVLLAAFVVPPLRSHLRPFEVERKFFAVATRPAYLKAFAMLVVLVSGGFFVFPYLPGFLMRNVGLPPGQLWLVYLFGGAATFVSMNLVGRLADRFPRLLLFRIISVLALGAVLAVTRLPAGTPVPLLLATTTVMMALLSARMVPLMAVVTGIAAPQERGTFMSVSAALQQLGLGLGASAAGLLVTDEGNGTPLEGFGNAGIASVAVGLLAVAMAGLLKPARSSITPAPPTVPMPSSSPAVVGISPAPGVHGRV